MNERIKQLAEQQGLTGPNYLISSQELEKFAELIVRECANMAEWFHHSQYDFTGNLELHEFIKDYFGVEE